MDEAIITVNGHELRVGEAMTIRVALTDFLFELSDPNALGDDAHGRRMTAGYRDCAKSILRLMTAEPALTRSTTSGKGGRES